MARGLSRMPLILARLYEEDIKFDKSAPKKQFSLSPSAMQRNALHDTNDRMMADLGAMSNERN